MKNRMGKTRKQDNPYLIFQNDQSGWEWKVLKAYQGDNSKPYARWFVAVTSPHTYGTADLGDEYVKGIVDHGSLTYVDPALFETDEERAEFMHNLNAARLREPAQFGG
jgi:hypothetical protein